MIPGEPIEICAGLLYGPVWGTLSCMLGILMGSLIVYALVKKEEKQEKKVFLPKQLQAPVKEGQKIGRVCYYVEGELLREIPLYSDRQITKMTFWGTLEHIFGLWVHKC